MKSVTCLQPSMSLAQARDILVKHHFSGAPVVNDSGEIVGVFSQTDFLRGTFSLEVSEALGELQYLDPALRVSQRSETSGNRLHDATVAEFMSEAPVCASPDEYVPRLAALMRENHVHRVFITEQGKLLGIVSAFDLLAVLC